MTNDAAGGMRDSDPLAFDIDRQRVIIALRAGLAMLLAVCVATVLRLDAGIFTLVPTLVILFFFRNESYIAGLSLVAGVLLGGLVEVVVIHLFMGSQFIFFVANAVLIMIGAYWIAQAMKGRWPLPFTAIFALIALTSTTFHAIDDTGGGLQTALYLSLESSIGILCTWFITKFVWPYPRSADLVSSIRSAERACATLLRQIAARYASGQPPGYIHSSLSLIRFKMQFDAIENARGRLMRDDPPYRELTRRLERVRSTYIHTRLMARSLETRRCHLLAENERRAVAGEINRLADNLDDAAVVSATDEQCDGIPSHLAVLKSNMTTIERRIRQLRGEGDDEPETDRRPAPAAMNAFPQFALETDSLKKAIKITLALVICLVIHLAPHLPAGNFLVIGAIIVLIQPDTGRSQLRVRLWIVGVLAGTAFGIAALGLVAMLPHFLILLLVLALGFLIGGYYAAGPDEVSYAGLQFCVTLVIVLGLSALPIDTVQNAQGRVFGAAIGFVVALVIALGLWPDHPVTLLRQGLADSLRKAGTLLSDMVQGSRLPDVSRDRFHEALYVDVRGNLELLHDASFISNAQMKDPLNCQSMIHVSATLFAQLFTIWDMLRQSRTERQKAWITGPLLVHINEIVAVLALIAHAIETPDNTSVPAIRQRVHRLQATLTAESLSRQQNGDYGSTEPELIFFGDQIAHDIVDDLALLVDDLSASTDTRNTATELPAEAVGGS